MCLGLLLEGLYDACFLNENPVVAVGGLGIHRIDYRTLLVFSDVCSVKKCDNYLEFAFLLYANPVCGRFIFPLEAYLNNPDDVGLVLIIVSWQ